MTNEKLRKIIQLILDLGFDYDRMSRSGQETYEEIMNLIGDDNYGNS